MDKKLFIIAGGSTLLLFCFFLLVFFLASIKEKNVHPPIESPTPTPVKSSQFLLNGPSSTQQRPVKLLYFSPADGARNVSSQQEIVITFDQPVATESVSFSIFPELDVRISSRLNSIIIIPNTPYQPNIIYTYSLFTPDNTKIISASFSSGNSQTPINPLKGDYKNTDSLGDSAQRENYPDVYLASFTPYDGTSFFVNNEFESSPSGHYIFVMTQKLQTGKSDFFDWLKKLGLTQSQIDRITVTYQ